MMCKCLMETAKRWPRRSAVKPNEALAAIRKYNGVLADAAEELGMARSSLARMASNHSEELARALKDEREKLIDSAEKGLAQKVRDGDTKAIIWVLATIGRTSRMTMPKDTTLGIGDTTSTITIQTVSIVSVPADHFYDAEGRLVGPGGLTIEFDFAGGDQRRLPDLTNARLTKPN